MRIWILNVGEEIPTDPGSPRLLRAAILARELARRGHQVTWWNSSVNHQQKIQRVPRTTSLGVTDGLETVLLWGRLYDSNRSLARIASNFESAAAFLIESRRREAPDIIVAGYPTIELAAAALLYSRSHSVPFVVDFRDMWPDIIEDELKGLRRMAAAPLLLLWRVMKKWIVAHSTAIVGVTQGFVDWALHTTGVPAKGVTRVFHLAVDPCQPAPERIEEAESYWTSLGVIDDGSTVILSYAGAFSERYDLDTLVRAACDLPMEYKNRLKIVLCGRGDMSVPLRHLAAGQPHIILPGWRSASEIRVLLGRSHVGLLPYRSTKDYVCHFPNKVGEYLSAALPILTGLTGQTRQMLGERGIGYFYDECSVQAAKQALIHVVDSREALLGVRAKALEAYADLFDPQRIYPEYCRFLERLADRNVA